MDHLGTHVGLHHRQSGKMDMKFEVRLTPKGCPEVNLCEQLFHSVKAYFRQIMPGNIETQNEQEWEQWAKSQVLNWFKQYKETDDLFNYTMQYLDKVIKNGGDLQQIALSEINLKSIQDVKLKYLPCDLEYSSIIDK